MSENVWAQGGEFEPQGGVERIASDEMPKATDVLGDTFRDMGGNFAGYLLAGLGMALVTMPLGFLAAVVLIAGMMPGMVMEDPVVLLGGTLAGFAAMMLLITVVSAPLNASLYRAMWAYVDKGEPLTFGASFARVFEDILPVIALTGITMALTMFGALFCYVGAFVVGFLLHLAMPALIVDRLGVFQAIGFSMRHARTNPGAHLAWWGLGMAILLVSMNIPVVGVAVGTTVYMAYNLNMYKRAFHAPTA